MKTIFAVLAAATLLSAPAHAEMEIPPGAMVCTDLEDIARFLTGDLLVDGMLVIHESCRVYGMPKREVYQEWMNPIVGDIFIQDLLKVDVQDVELGLVFYRTGYIITEHTMVFPLQELLSEKETCSKQDMASADLNCY